MSPADLHRLRTDPALEYARQAGREAAARAVEQGVPATITIERAA